jgi:hypothetical protein
MLLNVMYSHKPRMTKAYYTPTAYVLHITLTP